MKAFWNVIAVLLFIATFLFTILFLVGCNPESPESRIVWGIKAYNVGGTSYNRVRLTECRRPVRCETDFVAHFIYADATPVEVGGLRFHNASGSAEYYQVHGSGPNYWVPTEQAGTVSALVTNDSGYGLFTSWCTQWGVRMLQTGYSAGGRRTIPTTVARAGYENRYDSMNGGLIPWYGQDSQWTGILGGHYSAGGYSQFSSVPTSTIRPVRPSALNNRSVNETTFLDDNAVTVASGFEVTDAVWSMQRGEPGEGYAVAAEHLTLLDHSDTSTLSYLSTPYFLSISVALADAVDASIIGFSVPAELTVGGVFVSPISMTVAALSADGKRMVIQSDYIVPIDSRDFVADDVPEWVYDRWTDADDPNDPAINIFAPMFYAMDDPNHVVYDPNFIDHNFVVHNRLDPERYRPLICVPVAEGHRLQIEFTDATISAFIPFLAENWLTSNAVVDLNGDGIVNFKDVVLFMKEFQ